MKSKSKSKSEAKPASHSTVKKGVHQHESAMHKGEPKTKLKLGK